MSYVHGKGGTVHHKIHTWTGWGVIVGLPFALVMAVLAVLAGPTGIVAWVASPLGAVGLLAFATAALWYCKLEMDEVIMDYAGAGMRRFGLLANTVTALILWVAIAYSVISLAFL